MKGIICNFFNLKFIQNCKYVFYLLLTALNAPKEKKEQEQFKMKAI